MPARFSLLPGSKQSFTTIFIAVILAAGIFNQPLCAQTETDSTNSASSGVAEKWQNAKEKGSNAWEDVKDSSVRAWENTKEGSSNVWSSLKGNTTEAWTNATAGLASKTNYLYAKKDDFVAQADAELKDLDQKIQQLSDKTASAASSAKTEAQQKLKSVEDQRGQLNQKLDAAKKAGASDWNKAQVEFQKGYDDTKDSVKAAWNWLKSKTS